MEWLKWTEYRRILKLKLYGYYLENVSHWIAGIIIFQQ